MWICSKCRTLKTSFRTVLNQGQLVSYKRQPGHKLLSDQCQTLSTILSAQNVNTDTSVAKNKLLIDQCQISRHNLSSYVSKRTNSSECHKGTQAQLTNNLLFVQCQISRHNLSLYVSKRTNSSECHKGTQAQLY